MKKQPTPEALGFSPHRLRRVTDHLERYVADDRLPGWQLVVSRRGRPALSACHGQRDAERGTIVGDDTIWRIYSMSKPITSVALMTLYETGAFQLDDPIGRFVPELADLQVWQSGEGEHMETVPAERAVTIRDLLTHTAGFTYGFMHAHPVDALYRAREIGGVATQGNLASMIARLGETPLQFQPGQRWNYSVATDVLGHLIEVLTGEDLDDALARLVLDPLGMHETAFSVPDGAAKRFAACYERTPGGVRLQDDPVRSPYLERPSFLSGGGGLVSTAADYLRFCRMLLGGGELDGVRILGPRTLDLMRRNHLPSGGDLTSMGQPVFSETRYDGIGFGLGWSVVLDPARAQVTCSPGELAWGGMASTAFWVDPAEDLAVIFMTQLIPSSSYPVRRELRSLVYQALVD